MYKLLMVAVGLIIASPAAAAEYPITIINDGGYDLCELRTAPRTKKEWSENIIGDTCLKVGDSRVVTVTIDEGCLIDWQFRVSGYYPDKTDTTELIERWNFDICENAGGEYHMAD